MSRLTATALSLLVAATAALPAQAAGKIDPAAPDSCITLSENHKAARRGSDGLAIQDGDKALLLNFGGYCAATAQSSLVRVSTDGQTNVLCPSGSKVSSRRDECYVRQVRPITAEEFARYARRR